MADCGVDEWLLCVATAELKERLVKPTGSEKKMENILRETAFQHTAIPPTGPGLPSHWPSHYSSALSLARGSAALMLLRPSVGHFQVEEVRFYIAAALLAPQSVHLQAAKGLLCWTR